MIRPAPMRGESVVWRAGGNVRRGTVVAVEKGRVVVREANGLPWHFSDPARLQTQAEWEAEWDADRAADERHESTRDMLRERQVAREEED